MSSTGQTSNQYGKNNSDSESAEEDFSPEEEDVESMPFPILYQQKFNGIHKSHTAETPSPFLVRKPSQKRFSDFQSTTVDKAPGTASTTKGMIRSSSLRKTNSSGSLGGKGIFRNVQFSDETRGRRKQTISNIQNMQKEYEKKRQDQINRRTSRPSTIKEEKSGPVTFDSITGDISQIDGSPKSRKSDLNPLARLFHSKKRKSIMQNGVSTDKLALEKEEPVVVVDKRLSVILNDKAGTTHFQRGYSIQRHMSLNGGASPPKLRNILKKHSIKKASYEFQSLLKQLKTHHNKPTLYKYFYRVNRKVKRHFSKVSRKLKSLKDAIFPTNPFKMLINLIMMMFMAFEIFIIPMKIAFAFGADQVFSQIEWVEIAFFLIDVLLNFHTIYFIDSVPITDHKLIAINYLRGWFVIDALSCIPFQTLLGDKGNDIGNFYVCFHVIKVIKAYRLVKIFRMRKQWSGIREYLGLSGDMSVSVEVNGILRLVKLMFLLFFIIHWMACFWYLLGNSQHPVNWLAVSGLEDNPWQEQYLAALYWASTTMMTVGYGDMYATNSTERIYNIIGMLFGCGIFGYSLNQIGDIINQINAEVNYKDMRMDQLTKFLNKNEVDPNFQRKIKQYMEFKLDHERTLRDSDQVILDSISGSLRNELLRQINGKVLKNNILFQKSFGSHFLLNLSMSLDERVLAPDEYIFKEGETLAPSIFFIIRGKVALFLERHSIPLKNLEKGDHIGELSFFTSNPRESTAKTLTFCSLFFITKEKFLQLIDEHQFDKEVFHMVKDKVNLYRDYKSIAANCLICGSSSHLHDQCISAHIMGEREDVIRRYHVERKQFDETFIRKPLRRFNARIDLQEVQLRTKQYRITESLKTHANTQVDLSASEKQKKDKKQMMIKIYNEHLETNAPAAESGSIDFSNSEFTDVAENDAKLGAKSLKILSDIKDIKGARVTKASTTLQALFTGDLAQRQRYKKVLLENRGISDDDFDSTEVWEEPVIDQVKNFQIYFPHNNLAKILEQWEYNKVHKNRKYQGVRLDTDQEIVLFKKKLGKIFAQSKRMSVTFQGGNGEGELKRKQSLFSRRLSNFSSKAPAMRSKTLA